MIFVDSEYRQPSSNRNLDLILGVTYRDLVAKPIRELELDLL